MFRRFIQPYLYEIIQAAWADGQYTIKHTDGGYIFCTSNVPFKGMPPERYQLALDVWKRMRDYTVQ